MKNPGLLYCAAILAVTPALSYAGIVTYTSEAAFDAALPSIPVEGFELGNVVPGDALACASPVNVASNDACFSPGAIVAGLELNNGGVNHGGQEFALLGAGFFLNTSNILMQNYSGDTLNVVFNPTAHAVGFDLYSLLDVNPFEVDVFGTAGPLGSFSVTPDFAGAFFGISSTGPIVSLAITSPTGDYIGIDNVAFAPIPEPQTLWLCLAAAAGLLLKASNIVRKRYPLPPGLAQFRQPCGANRRRAKQSLPA